MDKNMSHTFDLSPRNLGMTFLIITRSHIGSLTDNLYHLGQAEKKNTIITDLI